MISWDENRILGCGTKTKKGRETPIVYPDFIAPVLHILCDQSQSKVGKVLCMNEDNFYKQFKQLKERCGIRPEVRPYSSRHYTGTALALQNISPSIIMDIMATDFFRRKGIVVDATYLTAVQNPTLDHARELAAEICRRYKKDEFDEVFIIFTQMLKGGIMKPTRISVLPITKHTVKNVPPMHTPTSGLQFWPDARGVLDSMAVTPRAMLSRAAAGIRGTTLIVNVPGSPKAAAENLNAVIDTLAHGLAMLRGGLADCAAGS